MGYWQKRIPEGKQCFVHYAIGSAEVISVASDRLKAEPGLSLLGVYKVEPQCSAYPSASPLATRRTIGISDSTSHTPRNRSSGSNFFPAQPYLFEKTFAVWTLFQMLDLKGRGENNQLVASVGEGRLIAHGVDEFVQVNLNRFTSLPAFFNAAHEAGKHTFTSIRTISGTACS